MEFLRSLIAQHDLPLRVAKQFSEPESPEIKIRRRGFTTLTGGDLRGNGVVDIIFVHGLNGHPKNTWTYENGDTSFYWPADLGEKLPNTRIMVYGYNADLETGFERNLLAIGEFAGNFLNDLSNERDDLEGENRPIIFIAHSLGGLLVKKAMIKGRHHPHPYERALVESVRGFLFFSTPHAGSNLSKATRIQILRFLAKTVATEIPPRIESLLETGAPQLFDDADEFRTLERYRSNTFFIKSYCEGRETAGLSQRVVEPQAAVLNYAMDAPYTVDANHQNMVRFQDREDQTYINVFSTLRRMLRDIRGPSYQPPLAADPRVGDDSENGRSQGKLEPPQSANPERAISQKPASSGGHTRGFESNQTPKSNGQHTISRLPKETGRPSAVFSKLPLDQKEAVKWLGRTWMSPKDTWDGTNWLQEPISRYKIVFQASSVGVQIDSDVASRITDLTQLEKVRPWLATRTTAGEQLPEGSPQNCRVIVFDCVSYSTPQLLIIAFDQETKIAVGHKVFYNTSFSGSRSVDESIGMVRVTGLVGQFSQVFLGSLYSTLWFKTPLEADTFLEIMRTGQKAAKDYERRIAPEVPPAVEVEKLPDLDQQAAIRWLAKAHESPKDSWDGKHWLEEPIERYKIVFQTSAVKAQLEWDGRTWQKFSCEPDSEKYMPWVASRPGIEVCPIEAPRNCRVVVIDCVNYSVPWMRILTIDESTGVALAQEIFYNTSFQGVRSIADDNEGYVLVKGLCGKIGPEYLGCMYSRLWFQTCEEADTFCEILSKAQKKSDDNERNRG